jgi:hypothetical protein
MRERVLRDGLAPNGVAEAATRDAMALKDGDPALKAP